MKSNTNHKNPAKQTFRSANANQTKRLIQAMAVGFVSLALTLNSMATLCVLTGNDASGSDSFDNAGHWSSGLAPSAGNSYFSMGFTIRTTTGTAPHTFQGDSLTLSNAATAAFPYVSLALKGDSGSTVTVNNLIMQTNSGIGNISNSGGATDRIAGNISIQGPVTMSDVNSAPRWIGIDSTLSGSGAITNAALVIYSANNTNFTGPLIAMFSTGWGNERGTIIVTNEAAMGGNPASFNAAQLELNNGIFSPQGSFALDHSNAGITIDSAGGIFDIKSGLFLTNSEPLAGTGTLALTNAGTLLQLGSGANFTGTLSVNNGAFILGAGSSLGSSVTVASGATFDVSASGLTLGSGKTLAGNGTVTGAVAAGSGSILSPGGSGTAATLTISSNLTLSGGGTLLCDFLATNDTVAVGGNFSPSGVTSIQLASIPAVGDYPLITVAGTLGGSAGNFHVLALTTRNRSYAVVYDTVSSPQRVLLHVTSSGSAANLVWQGDVVNSLNNVWDLNVSSNWVNGASSDVYFDGDTVNFTDSGATNQPTLDIVANPTAVNFNSSSNYSLTSLTGAGNIAGVASVNKGGTGTLVMSITNTYAGGTIITNGVFQIGYTNALGVFGTPSGATALAAVSGTGTLDINGAQVDAVYTNIIKINGNGFSATQGAIHNTSGGLTSGGGDVGVGSVSLLGNSTVSAVNNWQIGNTGQGIIGNGFTLTKIGSGYLYLKHAAASDLGGFVIAGGGVLFWDHGDALGTTATITLTNGGFIDTWNPVTQFAGLTFNNSIVVNDAVNGGAIINIRTPYNHPPSDIFNGSVTLNGTLTFTNTASVGANQYNNNLTTYGKITMNGNISGTGGIIALGNTANYIGNGSPYYGGSLVILTGNNSYSGPTMVTNFVQLLITTANQSGGAYDLVDNGTLDVAVAAGKPTIPMSSLTLEQVNLYPGNLGFTRLAAMPSSPVIYATNLSITSGSFILPPSAGYSVGQFPLIKYNGSIGGAGFAGLTLGTLPTGVTASLVDNSANHTIDLLVSTAGITWTGASSTNWDIGATVNWFNPVSALAETYQDGETVVFGDGATNFSVSIAQIIQPRGITVNSASNYTFSIALGGISGSAALIKGGSGTLTLACTNNTFTGGTTINGGTIKLADLNYTYPYGGGALNNNLGTVSVANGGTLDVNAVQVPNYQSYGPEGYNVFISGSGVGGNGALVNNNTNNNDNADPGYVTLTGDATVGGIADVNIRHGVSPQLSSQSSGYTLTKVGAGQFRIRYLTTVSTNFGPINILGGIVSYESSSRLGFGDASKPVTIGSGGGFAWGTAVTACARPLICSNSSTIYAYNTTSNVFNSPVTLVSGNVNLNANYYNGMTFSNVISGAGGVTLQYQGYATFAAANTYTGPTTVANANAGGGSILRLIGAGAISSSSGITLQGITANQSLAGALDASGRTDRTLTLVSGQTLRGDNGSYVKGNVIAGSGAVILPGGITNIQYMSCSNNLTLQAGSTVTMDVSLDGGATNDLIKVVGTNNYGGTLQLTNIGVTALTAGSSFKLFSNGSFTGNFSSITGSAGSGLGWTFNPTNGVATVVATTIVPTAPTTLHTISIVGGNVVITGTNAQAGGTYYLMGSTNVAKPLSQWVPVTTNVISTANYFTFIGTNVVSPNVPQQFFFLSNTN